MQLMDKPVVRGRGAGRRVQLLKLNRKYT